MFFHLCIGKNSIFFDSSLAKFSLKLKDERILFSGTIAKMIHAILRELLRRIKPPEMLSARMRESRVQNENIRYFGIGP